MEDDKESIARRAWLAKLVVRLQGDRSQQEFADLLGVTRQTVGDYTGRNEDRGVLAATDPAGIDIAYWSAFAQMSGVSVDELYQAMLDESQEVAPDPKQIDRSLLRQMVSASVPTKLAVLQAISKFFIKPDAIASLAENGNLALVPPNSACHNHHQSLTEVFYWMVKESALKEFRRSLNALLTSTDMGEILEFGRELTQEGLMSLAAGDRLPTVQELRMLSSLLRKEDGDFYSTEELFDLFDVPKKVRLTARQSGELKV